MDEMGKALRLRRTQLGLSQEELANLAGCRRLFVHELETGATNPRLDKLMAILKVLGCQLSIEPGRGEVVVKLDARH
ncbi:MAG: hypothetical protein BGO01_11125 [Armatimonadetes bacterium 55-13]|nr:helix-turn-helix domain-containing protein [Armatimonadota bacterium]ODU51454.1 MAG: hypothetical protein ABT09_03825 [bacterium SCN 57-13]OJU63789.1 MAG: hypothetical protein BGO01_11125 [Armatimonadetes bacterium 55-13]